jgi:hypothetical protein
MARACTACASPHRDDVDARLIANRESYRAVAERYALSPDAVWRHARNHLPGEEIRGGRRTQGEHPPSVVEKAEAVVELARRDGLVAEVRALQGLAERILALAMERGELRTALGSLDRLQRGIQLLAQLSGLLEAGSARVEVIASATASAAVAVDVSPAVLAEAIGMAQEALGGPPRGHCSRCAADLVSSPPPPAATPEEPLPVPRRRHDWTTALAGNGARAY